MEAKRNSLSTFIFLDLFTRSHSREKGSRWVNQVHLEICYELHRHPIIVVVWVFQENKMIDSVIFTRVIFWLLLQKDIVRHHGRGLKVPEWLCVGGALIGASVLSVSVLLSGDVYRPVDGPTSSVVLFCHHYGLLYRRNNNDTVVFMTLTISVERIVFALFDTGFYPNLLLDFLFIFVSLKSIVRLVESTIALPFSCLELGFSGSKVSTEVLTEWRTVVVHWIGKTYDQQRQHLNPSIQDEVSTIISTYTLIHSRDRLAWERYYRRQSWYYY